MPCYISHLLRASVACLQHSMLHSWWPLLLSPVSPSWPSKVLQHTAAAVLFVPALSCRGNISESRYAKELPRQASGGPPFPHLLHLILTILCEVLLAPLTKEEAETQRGREVWSRSLSEQVAKAGLEMRFSEPPSPAFLP